MFSRYRLRIRPFGVLRVGEDCGVWALEGVRWSVFWRAYRDTCSSALERIVSYPNRGLETYRSYRERNANRYRVLDAGSRRRRSTSTRVKRQCLAPGRFSTLQKTRENRRRFQELAHARSAARNSAAGASVAAPKKKHGHLISLSPSRKPACVSLLSSARVWTRLFFARSSGKTRLSVLDAIF